MHVVLAISKRATCLLAFFVFMQEEMHDDEAVKYDDEAMFEGRY